MRKLSGEKTRNKKGHFIPDDPETPHINEAYKDGYTPENKLYQENKMPGYMYKKPMKTKNKKKPIKKNKTKNKVKKMGKKY